MEFPGKSQTPMYIHFYAGNVWVNGNGRRVQAREREFHTLPCTHLDKSLKLKT